jgi:hypothetical protein
MVCLRNVSVDTLLKGDTENDDGGGDDDNNNNNNNNNSFRVLSVANLSAVTQNSRLCCECIQMLY